ncbi:Extracellular tail, of 10TM putative phosphate transporter [Teratosphaeria destructans]|uniref:Extracellular tail, of 10TM putative phosphate transporter n=1 Tax=Teratosphaeria destructans TaxID=418781 RepID=A0A9W7SVD8_9PEZI|nr:Extracellular tail, of 10TM putative phosphate transporter [Teratosphaeria destructans]
MESLEILASDHGGHRDSSSTSGAGLLAAFIPSLIVALAYTGTFVAIRNRFRNIYAPRNFLGTVPEEDRTPAERASGSHWFHTYRNLSDIFVLQHNSLDAYLFLRFLKVIIGICFVGSLLTWPILLPINATGGNGQTQLDKLTFSNIAKNNHTWAHVVVAWVFFLGLMVFIVWERLRLIGLRQAYYVNDEYASRLSARTVLWINAPADACQPENIRKYFGDDAVKLWAVKDTGDLDALITKRNDTAFAMERAELDLIIKAVKLRKRQGPTTGGVGNGDAGEGQHLVPRARRPTSRQPPLVGKKVDILDRSRRTISELAEKIDASRAAPSRNVPAQSAVFVAFKTQAAAHRAYQRISLQPRLPTEDRFLAVQPKDVLWKNLAKPASVRVSKASLALVFVIAFTIFFSIPVGIIGTISNAKYLANNYDWLAWINKIPPVILDLLTGLLPPFLTSWFVSYVPKLFRHIAKLSGEPTTSQAELKTQAWYFAFQVIQVFLVTTTASGASAVTKNVTQNPASVPDLLAESLPKASNFYLTYFVLQGLGAASNNLLRASDLCEYLFYEYFWDKTPREKFTTYAQMKGTPFASWFPKFTNLLVIAIAYSTIAPLILGFATVGIFLYYLVYRYNMLYIIQTKIDTKGEAYKRALQQMPTGTYLAELCLIGLLGARKATVQTALMIVLLVLTAIFNLIMDRILRPLELYLGVDVWQEQEVPLLAERDGVHPSDHQGLHAASHGRRLGINKLPGPAPRLLSEYFDAIISSAREQTKDWIHDLSAARGGPEEPPSEDDIDKAYLAPAFTSKTPTLWIPRDPLGASKQEMAINEGLGIPTTDDAAEVDENGTLHWDHNFDNVPIFKQPQKI